MRTFNEIPIRLAHAGGKQTVVDLTGVCVFVSEPRRPEGTEFVFRDLILCDRTACIQIQLSGDNIAALDRVSAGEIVSIFNLKVTKDPDNADGKLKVVDIKTAQRS